MTTKFTPGPWRINNKASMVVESPDRSIASCGGYANNTVDAEKLHEENKANARLIAAAPEMYELLHRVRRDNHLTKFSYDNIVSLLNRIDNV